MNLEKELVAVSAAALGDLGLSVSEVQDVQVSSLNKMIGRCPLCTVIVCRLATSSLNNKSIDACKLISSRKQDMQN